jgi:GNAT superfamily N-acetyltransferase
MPTKIKDQPAFTIQLFDPAIHDRADFSCGVAQIDNFLKLTAKKGSKADVVRIWVIIDERKHIIGFYGINMHSIDIKDMPTTYAKKALRQGMLPAAFITMIGVDKRQQNNGIGSVLVADAVNRIARVSNEIGTCVIILDVFDDGILRLKSRLGGWLEQFVCDTVLTYSMYAALRFPAHHSIQRTRATFELEYNKNAVAQRKKYYEEFGFISLPCQPLRLFLPIQTARELLM